MTKNIVYLVGAGASASISPQDIPVMNNFFEKAFKLNLVDDTNINKDVLTSLVDADRNGLFPHNINKNLLEGIAQKLQESMTSPNKGKIDLVILEQYKNIFLKNTKNQQNDFNLEKIFTKAWNTKDINKYQRLFFLINAVFRELDKTLSQQFNQAAHHKLSQLITENSDKYNHTFISYNYDIWLEKALFKHKLWHPSTGNGIGCEIKSYCEAQKYIDLRGAYNVPNIGEFSIKNDYQASKVTVLKPHGSLSWTWHVRNKQDFNTIVTLEQFNETACVAYSEEWHTRLADRNGMYEVRIVPPVDNKNQDEFAELDFFKKIEKNRNKAISEADIIVTIGYSMPTTDETIQKDMSKIISSNPKERVLVICDKQKFDNEKMKLEKKFCYIFQPNNIHSYYDGFDDTFVEKLKGIVDCL